MLRSYSGSILGLNLRLNVSYHTQTTPCQHVPTNMDNCCISLICWHHHLLNALRKKSTIYEDKLYFSLEPPFHYHDLDPDLSRYIRSAESGKSVQGSFEIGSIVAAAMWGRGRSGQFFRSARNCWTCVKISRITIFPTRFSPLIIVRTA